MKIYNYILAFALLFVVLASCKNNKAEDEENIDSMIRTEDEKIADDPKEHYSPNDTSNHHNELQQDEVHGSGTLDSDQTSLPGIMGIYIKRDEEQDSNCICYCLDINPSGNGELCLVPGEMYITSRFQKNSDNSINVFLINPLAKNTQGKEIPWQDFDRNVPIARIVPGTNGEIEFDWLGFHINGDLAMDYAILGKKTLEGPYKKK